MKTINAYIVAFLLCLTVGVGSGFCAPAEADAAVETTVRADVGNIIVDNPTDQPVEVLVYTITGSLLRNTKAPAGDRLYLDVPSGIYIVKAGNTTKRVAVRN